MGDNGGRTGHRYRALCTQVRAEEDTCHFCGGYIPKYLRSPDPASFTVHHKIPLGSGGSLLDRGNATAAHRRCNETSFACFQMNEGGELILIAGPAHRWISALPADPAPARVRHGWFCDDPGIDNRQCPTGDDGPHSPWFPGVHWEGPTGGHAA